MATKAELQAAQGKYDECLARAREAESQGRFTDAIKCAAEAWQHVEAMMQYERKFEDAEFRSLPCIDLVLRIAPHLLHNEALEQLGALLKSRKSIDKHATDDLATRLTGANETLGKLHRLWDHIERHAGARQDRLESELGGEQSEWRGICECQETMGFFIRERRGNSFCLYLRARLDSKVRCKCIKCGAESVREKRSALSSHQCERCEQVAAMVWCSEVPQSSGEYNQ